ncbi:Versiconal hemiacetal acetate reductase [Hypsizygus marmoreus]|uniref:Versiconal hemiacetal acetate reductase n=1 Tax=Hypsizygus marmoreus TaxID=39966 RepID=A0A369J3Z0_HYPMA|nr:Versiconal hemiacetal acetate reductase [Hypsizygus marmoreus]
MSAQAEYVRLGKSGLRISVPVLGCMSIGDPKWTTWSMPEEQSFPLLKTAWDAGITTWDTANMYSNGLSESIIGKFIKENDIPRNKLVLITKVRFLVDHENMSTITSYFRPELKDTRDYVNQGGLSRTAIFNQVDDCLQRLGTDYIDILMIHMFDPDTPYEETMCALHDLVQSGKVRYLGASNVRAWQFIEMNNVAQLNRWTQFSCVQMEHSLLYRAEELELFAYCNYKGIGVLAYSPLMDGHLARPIGSETPRTQRINGTFFEKKRRESDLKIINRLIEIAEKKGWKMSQVALAWSATKITSPVVGANTSERLLEAIVAGKKLTEEEIKYLEEPYEAQPPRF